MPTSEPTPSSPDEGENGQAATDERHAANEKVRLLTEDERKQNHINSEKKRREAIRAGFDQLCAIVPGLEGQARSEGVVLKKTVEFIKEELKRRRDLVQAAEARGLSVPDQVKEPIKILELLEERDRQGGLIHNDDEA